MQHTQEEIDTEDLVRGRRYRIQHRAGLLPPRTGKFLDIVQSPGRVHARYHHVQGPGRRDQHVSTSAYWDGEWSFHESGESTAMRKATQSGKLYNAIPNNVLHNLRQFVGGKTRRRRNRGTRKQSIPTTHSLPLSPRLFFLL